MATVKAKASQPRKLSDQEVQATFSRYQSDLQTLAQKIGEIEGEADEHELVLSTLNEMLAKEPDRKCFRLIGGVLVERTVKDVVPALNTNRDGIRQLLSQLVNQYKSKETEFQTFTKDYKIKLGSAR
ncbi:Prefoldin beta-like protein [Clavulina sp. PMI_390]|nr:Prefoldin beta-like protein [Clavulina sp. PMI_390]